LSKVQCDAKIEPPYFTTTPQKVTNKLIYEITNQVAHEGESHGEKAQGKVKSNLGSKHVAFSYRLKCNNFFDDHRHRSKGLKNGIEL
jgi:hypothetical protein